MTKPRNSCPVKLPWGQVVSMAHRGTSRTGLGSHPFLAHVLVNTKCVFSFENCLWPIPPSLSHSTPYLCSAPAPPQTNPNQGPWPLPPQKPIPLPGMPLLAAAPSAEKFRFFLLISAHGLMPSVRNTYLPQKTWAPRTGTLEGTAAERYSSEGCSVPFALSPDNVEKGPLATVGTEFPKGLYPVKQ